MNAHVFCVILFKATNDFDIESPVSTVSIQYYGCENAPKLLLGTELMLLYLLSLCVYVYEMTCLLKGEDWVGWAIVVNCERYKADEAAPRQRGLALVS